MNRQNECAEEVLALPQQLAGANAKIEEYRLREFAAYRALGYSPPVDTALPHLIDGMMGFKARLQDSLDSIERATGFQPGSESLSAWVDRVVKERDAAQKACAEMRSELGRIKVKPWAHVITQEDRESIGRILSSTDCGNDYVPRAELDAAEKNAAYWVQCEHELDEALGNLAAQFDRIERERDTARSELDRLKAQVKPLVEAIKTAGHFKAWDSEAQCQYPFSNSLAYQQALDRAKELGL